MMRPGYAVEYDFVDPRELRRRSRPAACRGLYFAGQINGTSRLRGGGVQGLLAGINAALALGFGDASR